MRSWTVKIKKENNQATNVSPIIGKQ